MLPDHYATLGIPPNARREVIRAAYVKLMRRYHPDRNPSAAASARARAVTAAYAILSVPAKRARYDLERNVAGRSASGPQRNELSLTLWFAAAFGIAVIAFLVPLRTSDIVLGEQANANTAVGGRPLRTLEVETAARASPNPRVLCSSPAVARVVKRGLFRRAARFRGSDAAAFDWLSDASQIRLTSPALASPGSGGAAISCTASVVIDLPPGVTLYSDRRSVTGAIAYSLRPSDRSTGGRIILGSVGAIAELLATVQPNSAAAAGVSPTGPQALVGEMRSAGVPTVDLARAPAPPTAPVAARTRIQRVVAGASPSFSCGVSSSWAAAAVCKSADLASLDRRLASVYGDAMERADASQRILLIRSDRRFLARRDSCSTEACVQSAYEGGMKEMEEIIADREPPG